MVLACAAVEVGVELAVCERVKDCVMIPVAVIVGVPVKLLVAVNVSVHCKVDEGFSVILCEGVLPFRSPGLTEAE